MRHARAPLVAIACGAVLAAGCGGSSSESSTATSVPGCRDVAAPRPSHEREKPPRGTVSRQSKLSATVSTSCGSFTIALDAATSPKTVSSFVSLARHRFYDGLSFNRVVPRFLIQGGDPLLNGEGDPGYTVVEPPPPALTYRRGIVAMSKAALQPPGTSGSQFFVVTAPADAGLPPVYALLGRVNGGFATVARIAKLGDRSVGRKGGAPVRPVVIERVRIR